MTSQFFEKPILNSPYGYPVLHWELDKTGQPTQQIIDKRRPAEFITPIPEPKKQKCAQQPDIDEGSFSRDVKDAFYQSIAEQFKHSQVIIFENEDPPADLEYSTNVIRFTGAGHGRRGFIPSDV